jgi:ClpP class serine protease
MTDQAEKWRAIVETARADYDADIYFYSGMIDDEGFGKLVSQVAEHKKSERGLLIMVTDGGQANAGYQIARLFQRVYSGKFTIFCPSRCKSAGDTDSPRRELYNNGPVFRTWSARRAAR